MKKVYVKPIMIFEDFTLSKSVAGTCEKKIETATQFQCGIEMAPGGLMNTIFLESMTGVCGVGSSEEKLVMMCLLMNMICLIHNI